MLVRMMGNAMTVTQTYRKIVESLLRLLKIVVAIWWLEVVNFSNGVDMVLHPVDGVCKNLRIVLNIKSNVYLNYTYKCSHN